MDAATIYALSSAPGKAGVAVIRVSGAGALHSLNKITKASPPEPRVASLRALYDPGTGEMIDRAVILLFENPASFTGETVVEYQLHGSPAVVSAMLSALSSCDGHRLAEPGEFTRRAFENGKLDLTAAEAVADLIHAETQMQRRQALQQMGGGLFRLYEDWRERLIKACAYVEAVIDFPDEDVPDAAALLVLPDIDRLIEEIRNHLDDHRRGERLRDGIHIAILGAPNAGKSSLLNALAQREAAIVSPMAGTTRDVIEVALDIGGYPVILADTAGLREELTSDHGHNDIEAEGIRRAIAKAEDADLRLLMFDGTKPPDPKTRALADSASFFIFSKSDHPEFDASPVQNMRDTGHAVLSLSTATGDNMDMLLHEITNWISNQFNVSQETPPLTRARHREALIHCVANLLGVGDVLLPELIAEQLRRAAHDLGRITGRVDIDDFLDVIFRDFCIGK